MRSLWFVDPDAPSILAFDLVDGRYIEAGRASGDDAVTLMLPFPVTIAPGGLIS